VLHQQIDRFANFFAENTEDAMANITAENGALLITESGSDLVTE
jgi:hypothetical protein